MIYMGPPAAMSFNTGAATQSSAFLPHQAELAIKA